MIQPAVLKYYSHLTSPDDKTMERLEWDINMVSSRPTSISMSVRVSYQRRNLSLLGELCRSVAVS